MREEKNMIINGKVYVLGKNIDTDQIIPAEYLNLVPTIPEEYHQLGSHALSGLPPEYPPFVRQGAEKTDYTIIIAGENFGCGSSREHAPIALGAAGIKAVVALSFARIFFRNAIATGALYPCESEQNLSVKFHTGDIAEIDLKSNFICHIQSNSRFQLKDIGAAGSVIRAGGLFKYARKTGMIKSTRL